MTPFPRPPYVGPLDPKEYAELLRNAARVHGVITRESIDEGIQAMRDWKPLEWIEHWTPELGFHLVRAGKGDK